MTRPVGSQVAALVADVPVLRIRLEGVLDVLTDADVAGPSALDGWTRGHVLAHLVGVGSAVARQIEHARAGRFVDFYDGGPARRDAEIEARATSSVLVHARDVRATALRVEAALASLGPGDWSHVTRHRGWPVLGVAHTWWRELGIHLTDLQLGPTSSQAVDRRRDGG